jgi:hypothetical protein
VNPNLRITAAWQEPKPRDPNESSCPQTGHSAHTSRECPTRIPPKSLTVAEWSRIIDGESRTEPRTLRIPDSVRDASTRYQESKPTAPREEL